MSPWLLCGQQKGLKGVDIINCKPTTKTRFNQSRLWLPYLQTEKKSKWRFVELEQERVSPNQECRRRRRWSGARFLILLTLPNEDCGGLCLFLFHRSCPGGGATATWPSSHTAAAVVAVSEKWNDPLDGKCNTWSDHVWLTDSAVCCWSTGREEGRSVSVSAVAAAVSYDYGWRR